MNSAGYCRDVTRRAKSSFFYPMLLLPSQRRPAIFALYAFCRTVDDIVDEVQAPAEITPENASENAPEKAIDRLNWWRDELTCTFEGRPEHPISREIHKACQHFDLPEHLFFEIIDGMEMDLHQTRYETQDDLEKYCHKVSVVVGMLAIRIFAARENHPRKLTEAQRDRIAHHLGMAFQITNILRDIAEDARRDRIYIPRDLMHTAGVSEKQMLSGIWHPTMEQAISPLGEMAQHHFDQAGQLMKGARRRCLLPAMVMSALYHYYLERLRSRQYNFENPVRISTPTRLWIAFKRIITSFFH